MRYWTKECQQDNQENKRLKIMKSGSKRYENVQNLKIQQKVMLIFH